MNDATIIDRSIPSLDALFALTLDRDIAQQVYDVLTETVDPSEVSEAYRKWSRQCVNAPDPLSHESKLYACDDLLGTCGVESVDDPRGETYEDEGIAFCPLLSYCNTGDTYAPTLMRNHETGEWLIASVGDIIENLADETCEDDESDDADETCENDESDDV